MGRDIALNTYRIKSPLQARVIENRKLTKDASPSDTRHVVFDVSGGPMEYTAGQSVGVLTPGLDEKGRPHAVRLYSVASHRSGEAGIPNSLSLCVKRVQYQDSVTGVLKKGVASNYVCDLKPGDTVRLTGPVGNRFLLPENLSPCNFIFIATGTGIAPFRGMLVELFQRNRSLGQNPFQGEVWLFFGVPYRTDLLYEGEFQDYQKYPNFHFVTAVSREESDSEGKKIYVQNRIAEKSSELEGILFDPQTWIYICGLKGMEKGLYESFQKMMTLDQLEQLKKRILVEVY